MTSHSYKYPNPRQRKTVTVNDFDSQEELDRFTERITAAGGRVEVKTGQRTRGRILRYALVSGLARVRVDELRFEVDA